MHLFIGLLAGAMTTISFIPQLLKVWRTKSADDLSTMMFIVFCVGVTLWLIYGLLVYDLAVIFSNALTLLTALLILILKFRYRGRNQPPEPHTFVRGS